MEINGLENLSPQQLSQEVQRGAKFVVFEYCISLLIVTLRRSTGIYFIRAGESSAAVSAKFTALSLILGWWGFPWGPIYTIAVLYTNLKGGRDVTMEVMNALDGKSYSTTII